VIPGKKISDTQPSPTANDRISNFHLGNLENCTPATILWSGAGAGSLVAAARQWKLIVFIGGIRKAGFRKSRLLPAAGAADAFPEA
jgi:hypothetical protein